MMNIIIAMVMVMVMVMGCKKEESPRELSVVFDTAIAEPEFDKIRIVHHVILTGGENGQYCGKMGLCYSQVNNNPTIENATVIDMDCSPETGGKTFEIKISPNTQVYVKAFVKITPQRAIDQPVYYGETLTCSTLAAPSLDKVYPLKGYFNDTVTIKSEGFSWFRDENKVFFNGVEAKVLRETGKDKDGVRAIVPRKAGKGKIKVQIRETVLEGPEFDFLQDEYDVYTLSGKSESGFADGNLDEALFNNPRQIVLDKNDNIIVADMDNHRVRKISPDGKVTTLAGSGVAGYADGSAASARFNQPTYLAVHPVTGDIYVTEAGSHCIRKISADGSTVSTFKGIAHQPGDVDGSSDMTNVSFNQPKGIAFNQSNDLFIADRGNHCIRKISSLGTTTTFAGYGDEKIIEGNGINASIANPTLLFIAEDNKIYGAAHILKTTTTPTGGTIYDLTRFLISISPSAEMKKIIDLDGIGIAYGLMQDADENIVIPAFERILKLVNNKVNVLFGATGNNAQIIDGPISKAKFHSTRSIISKSNKWYVTDLHSIRVIEKMK